MSKSLRWSNMFRKKSSPQVPQYHLDGIEDATDSIQDAAGEVVLHESRSSAVAPEYLQVAPEYLQGQRLTDEELVKGLGEPLVEPDPDADFDFVFIHGMYSNRVDAFTTDDGVFWPRDLLPKVLRENNIKSRIWSFGYNAQTHESHVRGIKVDTNTIFTHGENLISALAAERAMDRTLDRPIVFIAHCLGGLVLKSALNRSASIRPGGNENWESVFNSTFAIFYCGTPHTGSDKLQYLDVLKKLQSLNGDTNNSLLSSLQPESDTIRNSIGHYSEIQTKFKTVYVVETERMIFDGLERPEIVVPEACAYPAHQGQPALRLDRNHINLVKFSRNRVDASAFKSFTNTLIMNLRDENGRGAVMMRERGGRWRNQLSWRDCVKIVIPSECMPAGKWSPKYLQRTIKRKDLRDALYLNNSSPVLVYGPRGCGKSCLVREFLSEVPWENEAFERVFWLNARDNEALSESMNKIFRDPECKGEKISTLGPKVDQYLQFLPDKTTSPWKRLLVIFDGVDDLSLFAPLLKSEGNGALWEKFRKPSYKICVTTSDPIAKNYLHSDRINVSRFTEQESMQFLSNAHPRRLQDEVEIERARTLVNHFGNVPLAIRAVSSLLTVSRFNFGALLGDLNMIANHEFTDPNESTSNCLGKLFENEFKVLIQEPKLLAEPQQPSIDSDTPGGIRFGHFDLFVLHMCSMLNTEHICQHLLKPNDLTRHMNNGNIYRNLCIPDATTDRKPVELEIYQHISRLKPDFMNGVLDRLTTMGLLEKIESNEHPYYKIPRSLLEWIRSRAPAERRNQFQAAALTLVYEAIPLPYNKEGIDEDHLDQKVAACLLPHFEKCISLNPQTSPRELRMEHDISELDTDRFNEGPGTSVHVEPMYSLPDGRLNLRDQIRIFSLFGTLLVENGKMKEADVVNQILKDRLAMLGPLGGIIGLRSTGSEPGDQDAIGEPIGWGEGVILTVKAKLSIVNTMLVRDEWETAKGECEELLEELGKCSERFDELDSKFSSKLLPYHIALKDDYIASKVLSFQNQEVVPSGLIDEVLEECEVLARECREYEKSRRFLEGRYHPRWLSIIGHKVEILRLKGKYVEALAMDAEYESVLTDIRDLSGKGSITELDRIVHNRKIASIYLYQGLGAYIDSNGEVVTSRILGARAYRSAQQDIQRNKLIRHQQPSLWSTIYRFGQATSLVTNYLIARMPISWLSYPAPSEPQDMPEELLDPNRYNVNENLIRAAIKYLEVYSSSREELGAYHPWTLDVLKDLIISEYHIRRFDEAETHSLRLLQMVESLAPISDPEKHKLPMRNHLQPSVWSKYWLFEVRTNLAWMYGHQIHQQRRRILWTNSNLDRSRLPRDDGYAKTGEEIILEEVRKFKQLIRKLGDQLNILRKEFEGVQSSEDDNPSDWHRLQYNKLWEEWREWRAHPWNTGFDQVKCE
ncbi:hypothetical protein ABW19_dt0206738 [Dactylella cylindrospora]|nr:hypothetical protein ABW19_dt0206738 [Dactylella cylindrospora]